MIDTISLVLVSPSIVIMLKLLSTAVFNAFRRKPASTLASVVRKPSRVAISGCIMPAPLAMPPITYCPCCP